MIHYQIVTDPQEKQKLKTDFQTFFKRVYQRELADGDWEHQFMHSPYENSALFLAFEDTHIVGSALMIPQKYSTDSQNGSYFLWTTSAIEKKYRSQGLYAEILKMQREYAVEQKKDFIFAFPNKLAYPVVKLFGGFKDLYKIKLVKTTMDMLDISHIDNSLKIDDAFFQWRFEHKNYLFYEFNENILIAKKFEDSLDVLAIYKKESLETINFAKRNSTPPNTIITMDTLIKDNADFEILDQLSGTYFPINKDIDYAKIKLNLLMSDVF